MYYLKFIGIGFENTVPLIALNSYIKGSRSVPNKKAQSVVFLEIYLAHD